MKQKLETYYILAWLEWDVRMNWGYRTPRRWISVFIRVFLINIYAIKLVLRGEKDYKPAVKYSWMFLWYNLITFSIFNAWDGRIFRDGEGMYVWICDKYKYNLPDEDFSKLPWIVRMAMNYKVENTRNDL